MTRVNSTVANTPHPAPWIPIKTVTAAVDVVVVMTARARALAVALHAIVRRTVEAREMDPMKNRDTSDATPKTERDRPMDLTVLPFSAR